MKIGFQALLKQKECIKSPNSENLVNWFGLRKPWLSYALYGMDS